MRKAVVFGAALLLLLLAVLVYNAVLAQRVRDDVVYLIHSTHRPAGMIYVEFTKNSVTKVLAIPDGGGGVTDLAAAILAADSDQNKSESWTIESGATINLIVPPKHGETPMGTAHCERFMTVRNALQATPGLEPVN